MARRAEERVRQSRGSDLDIQRACAREVGGLDRQCMYLAREGERERGEERARHGVQLRVCEVNTFRNRVEKGGCVVERVRYRNMEIKNGCVLETDSFLRWLGEED